MEREMIKLLLIVGVFCLLAGITIGLMWSLLLADKAIDRAIDDSNSTLEKEEA